MLSTRTQTTGEEAMSMVYSHTQDKHIDTDFTEVYELSNGDVVEMDNDEALLGAMDKGLISEDELMALGFDKDLIEDWKNPEPFEVD
jgi:hypothetical protein